jgi:CDP-glucose 4,6-dehydratase
VARSWGKRASWSKDGGTHPLEAQYLKLDSSKAGASLEWHPVLSLNESIDWIVEWYRAFEAGDDLRRVTRGQIERYDALSHN